MTSRSHKSIFNPKLDLPDFKQVSGGISVKVSEGERKKIDEIAEKRGLSSVWSRNLLKIYSFISVAAKRYGNSYGFVQIPSSMLKYLAKDYDGVIRILEEENLVRENKHGRDKKTGIVRGNAFALVEGTGSWGKSSDYFIKLSEKGIKEYSSFILSFSSYNNINYNINRESESCESINSMETFSHNELSDNQLNVILRADFEERYRYLEYIDSKGKRYDQVPARHETEDGRYYHWLHSMHAIYRKRVYFNGSPLVENFDVTACFYTLIARLMKDLGSISEQEMQRYCDLVRNGDIYNTIKEWAEKTYGTPWTRDQVKERLQSWRNTISTRMEAQKKRDTLFFQICEWWKANYPEIGDAIVNYPTYRNNKNRKTKRLQLDCCKLETKYISGAVCSELSSKFGVVAFTVHDAVYITEKDKEKLDIMGVKIEDIFWKAIGI